MDKKWDIVSGDFEGNFYTHQKNILTSSEWNAAEKKYDIHLYRGELRNVIEEKEYKPENFRNRESFLLHNVTNVQFNLNSSSEESNSNRIYNFEQLLLRDAVIKESWELNGKTYGIISGKLLGKIKDEVKPADPKTPDLPIAPPDPIGKTKPDPPLAPPDTDDNTGNNGALSNVRNGCLNLGGCLSNIWRLLLALFLLLLILWFLKGCWNNHQKSENCCGERDSLIIENNRMKKEIDSIIKHCNFINDSLEQEDIQEELDELSTKIFFEGDTTTIRKMSENEIDKIVELLNQHKTLQVQVLGYRNGGIIENIDQKRADKVKQILLDKGIDENRVESIGMGISTLVDNNEYPIQYYDPITGKTVKCNRNMRVEIKIVKF